MDICSHSGLAATDNVNDHHGSCKNAIKSTHGVLKPPFVDELSVDVTKFLNIRDATEEDSISSTPLKNHEFQKEELCDEFLQSKVMTQSPKKCLSKDALLSGKTESHGSHQDPVSELSTHGDSNISNDPSDVCSISLPTKPVSAMKGSREKRGVTPPVKLTVKWAPDVYDPIPTSVSHVVTNNRSSSKHSRKNSKNKQKHGGSKSSRGSKSKDKRQVRKRGGNSSSSSSFSGMSYKFEQEEELVDFREQDEHHPGGMEFHLGNQDRLCGSSFMKRYGTSLHMSSVAEAT